MRLNSYFGYLKNTSSLGVRKNYVADIEKSVYGPYIINNDYHYVQLRPEYKDKANREFLEYILGKEILNK